MILLLVRMAFHTCQRGSRQSDETDETDEADEGKKATRRRLGSQKGQIDRDDAE